MKKIIKLLIKKAINTKLWINTVLIKNNKKKIGLRKKILAIKHNFSNDFFIMYNLNKDNINDYISEYERYLSRDINGEYKFILDNKIIFTQIFSNYVNIPKIECMILDKIYSPDGKIINNEDLLDIIKDNKVILKPINDGGGHGVYIIENNNSKYFCNYKEINKKELLEKIESSRNYIMNEYVNQGTYSKKIFPRTVNTIRIITIKDPTTGNYIIPCAVHRFGNIKTNGVDNASSGGYITEINVETGILGYTKSLNNLTPLEIHPDTNEKIKGTKIPNWKETKKELLEISSKFPFLPFIAWDVVITDTGYVILEANASSSLELFQIFNKIKNSKLGEFYKYYGITK